MAETKVLANNGIELTGSLTASSVHSSMVSVFGNITNT